MKYPNRIIRKGESDAAIVGAIQEQLNRKGVPVDTDGVFGPKTKIAVMSFQAQSRDSQGNPLVIDGNVGPITWAVLFNEVPSAMEQSASPLLAKAISIARGETGNMETPPGSNRGPAVEKYLECVGLDGGYPWCAAFVYWCFSTASGILAMTNPLIKTAVCMNHWKNTAGRKIIGPDATASPLLVKPGFIFIINHGGGQGHTGIVSSVEGPFIKTIEGNSNPAGSREGLGVFELTRKINTINAGFIDYS